MAEFRGTLGPMAREPRLRPLVLSGSLCPGLSRQPECRATKALW